MKQQPVYLFVIAVVASGILLLWQASSRCQAQAALTPDDVILSYFALQDQGQFEDAYRLLSPNQPHYPSLAHFVEGGEMFVESIEVLELQSYYDWARGQGRSVRKDKDDQKHYFVELEVAGPDGWFGAVPNGVHPRFVTVVKEACGWKIYAVDSGATW